MKLEEAFELNPAGTGETYEEWVDTIVQQNAKSPLFESGFCIGRAIGGHLYYRFDYGHEPSI